MKNKLILALALFIGALLFTLISVNIGIQIGATSRPYIELPEEYKNLTPADQVEAYYEDGILYLEIVHSELEVHTCFNTYYIKGLKVTDEKGYTEIEFKNREDLTQWLSEITLVESLNCDTQITN